MSALSASEPIEGSGPEALAALVVLLASQFMMAADFSVLNVALPEVGTSLGFSTGSLQWITTMFALCAAGCTLVFGRVGDYVGRRRIFTAGMVVLTASSLVGGLADSPAMLLAARTLQGLAAAAVTPAALALLTTSFTEPGLRTRALGLNSVMMSSGFSVGAILGGVLTDVFSWRWAFFINIPVAVAAIVVVPLVVDESRAEQRSRIDLPGALLITLGLFAGIYGVTRIGEEGLDAAAGGSLIAAAVLLGVLWAVESRTADALVPVKILKKPDIACGNLAALFIFGGETALIFFTGLYVQNVLGLSSMVAGLVLLGIGVGQIVAGTVGPRILQKVPPRTMLGVSLVLQGAFAARGGAAAPDGGSELRAPALNSRAWMTSKEFSGNGSVVTSCTSRRSRGSGTRSSSERSRGSKTSPSSRSRTSSSSSRENRVSPYFSIARPSESSAAR
ncbi:MFS transporter [Streptomyces sp. NPDC001980]|uniref:MFS transporter n=1 Tax=Streptomyces sp. NPDC001980 TaxID=3157126 RepID=UPI00332818B5